MLIEINDEKVFKWLMGKGFGYIFKVNDLNKGCCVVVNVEYVRKLISKWEDEGRIEIIGFNCWRFV